MNLDFENIESHPNFLYSDDKVIIMLSNEPIAQGQLEVFPKEQFIIAEQVPDELLGELFTTANGLSTVLFENLNCQGTNVIVKNGIPAGQMVNRFSIEIIPRYDGDGLNLQWPPQQYSEEQLSVILTKLTEYTAKIGKEEKPVQKLQEIPTGNSLGGVSPSENLKLKQFKRIP